MENKRIGLYVLGLSYNQLQSGAYALILAQNDGPYRIPIVIGAPEAQSIAIFLESIRTPRPLTHDLFVSFAHAFGVKLKDVFIYKLEDGIFSSELTFSDGERTVVIDARTSDAIALALRTNTPIFTTPEIIERAGFIIEDNEFTRPGEFDPDSAEAEKEIEEEDGDEELYESYSDRKDYHADPRPENYTIEELERTLADLIEKEDYEEAQLISEIINKKKNQ